MKEDPRTGEVFQRIVGRRVSPRVGELPSEEARRAMAAMASYDRTRAPNRIFIYRSHEEMEADRLR